MKVFISSTSKDLGEYRQAAHEVCNRLSLVPIGMEQFESMGAGATSGSRFKMQDADVYVGILANRYGYIEDGFDKSVTELEYEYAESLGLERLFFVAADAAHLPTYPGDDLARLAVFKARVDTLIRSTFENPWEFKYKLHDSLVKWMFRQRGLSSRRAFEPILADYSRFGGRTGDLAKIRTFLSDPDPGYLVITAPAGYGKTALAVKVLQAHREITAYHFFTSLYRKSDSDFLSEQFFLTNIVEQMKLWQLSPAAIGATPATLSGWVAAYHELLAQPLPEPRILLLDGLDEVKDWRLRPYLNVTLPANVKVIVTLRDIGQDWAEEYGFPTSQTTHLALDGLTRADVAELLTMAGPVAGAFARDEKLLDRVVEVTTPRDAVQGADPLYVTFLADDIEKGQVTSANIAATPRKLEDYLKTWWEAIQAQAKTEPAKRDVLGTLAAALGPIGNDDLVVLYPHLASDWMGDPIADIVGSMRRVLAGSGAEGYAFAHPRFRDYVRRYPVIQSYEATLLAYCDRWREHGGRYALRYAIRHFAGAGQLDNVFSTVRDETFHAAQKKAFGSARQTLNDLAIAITLASKADRFMDVLRCAGHYRHLAQAEGVARAIFDDVAHGRFDSAASAIEGYGFAKTSSAWVLALRCYLVWAATAAGDRKSAEDLVEIFDRQFGLGYHGANLHTTGLCNALMASAVARDPDLAGIVGVAAGWCAGILDELNPPIRDAATRAQDLLDLEQRIRSLELTIGEHPENPEYIDEIRAGDYMMHLRHSLIGVARDAPGRDLIRRALGAVQNNPYPRYRDLGLVAIGEAALAVPDPMWTMGQIQTVLEIGLEKEGITFTFDLAAQLSREAARRGLPAASLAEYLKDAANSQDRWGTRMRTASALAAAELAQGDRTSAFATLESATGHDGGFAGYISAHLLTLASRWLEFNAPDRIDPLGLMTRALSQARRVRDPHFNAERQKLVGLYRLWLTQHTPDWAELSAMLRSTPDADTRRAYKDLVTARWAAEGRWDDWGPVVIATLADATALDFVLARLAGRTVQRHRSGVLDLSDDELREAVDLCALRFATSRPWNSTVAAEYA
jgi:hypothetical protein